MNRHDGVTIVMVTHNLDIANTTDRVLRMTHGKLNTDVALPYSRPKLAAV